MQEESSHIAVDRHEGRIVQWKGETYLYFSGTNYLGVSTKKEVHALIQEGISLYGCHVSISRSANIGMPVFARADKQVATWLGTEHALLFSSGFTACQILLKSLEENGLDILYTPGVHPANWRNSKDKDALPWQALLHHTAQSSSPMAIFCKSVDPIYLRAVSFNWLQALPTDKDITLIVDDSHTMGVWGTRGEGIYPTIKEMTGGRSVIVVGSLGKGIGMPAGVIGGCRRWTDIIQATPYYTGASMPNPAFVHALIGLLPMLPKWQKKLQENITLFQQKILKNRWQKHFAYNKAFPVFLCRHKDTFDHLYERRILIAKFRYPSKEDSVVSRIVLSGAHTKTDIQTLCQALTSLLK